MARGLRGRRRPRERAAPFRPVLVGAGLRRRPEVRARAAPPDALEPRPKQQGNKKKKKKARTRAGGFGVST